MNFNAQRGVHVILIYLFTYLFKLFSVKSESEQEGSSSSCDGPGGHGSRHSDIQEMIKKQEKAIIDFTSDREELIKESRQNELFGDEIIKIIRLKCPSILGILV